LNLRGWRRRFGVRIASADKRGFDYYERNDIDVLQGYRFFSGAEKADPKKRMPTSSRCRPAEAMKHFFATGSST